MKVLPSSLDFRVKPAVVIVQVLALTILVLGILGQCHQINLGSSSLPMSLGGGFVFIVGFCIHSCKNTETTSVKELDSQAKDVNVSKPPKKTVQFADTVDEDVKFNGRTLTEFGTYVDAPVNILTSSPKSGMGGGVCYIAQVDEQGTMSDFECCTENELNDFEVPDDRYFAFQETEKGPTKYWTKEGEVDEMPLDRTIISLDELRNLK